MSFRGGSQSVPRQSWSGYSPCATSAADRSLTLAVLIALLTLSVELGAAIPASGQCELHEDAKLTASDPHDNDRFGQRVAISGSLVIVGAPWADGPVGANQGLAYLFDVSNPATPVRLATLTASDAEGDDAFGNSVAISGALAVVGATSDDTLGWQSNTGSAYVFDVSNPANPVEVAHLTASDAAVGDEFGIVAVSGDTLIVGAREDDNAGGMDAGSAYIFVRSGTTWTQQAKLTASDAAPEDGLGWAVSISGDTVVIGARPDVLSPPNVGKAYVFVKPIGGWSSVSSPITETAKLTASDAAPGDEFGVSVAVSGDLVVVGAATYGGFACCQGSVYVFRKPVGGWSSVPSPITETAKLTASDAAYGDSFGYSVTISDSLVVVGAIYDDGVAGSGQGSAYVFDLCDPDNPVELAKLTASDAAANDDFGGSVAVNGALAVVGAHYDEVPGGVDQGSAYVFELASLPPCVDCNGNGVADACDIAICPGNPACADCNANGVPDECDIGSGSSPDLDGDGIPDECKAWFHCVTSPGYFDYAPHRIDPEAEQLAMHLSGQLRAPDSEYDRIRRDLQIIRSVYPKLQTVVDDPDYVPNHLIVRLDPSLPWTGYVALNDYYQVIEDQVIFHSLAIHLIKFCDNLNAFAVSREYAVLPEVLYAEPDYVYGTDDQITITPDGDVLRYQIKNGFWDCMAGCICATTWEFNVDAQGGLSLISYVERGAQSGCIYGEVACCIPPGDCRMLDVEACEEQGGFFQEAGTNCDADGDWDTVSDVCDNCPTVANPLQEDSDYNGIGDACEPPNIVWITDSLSADRTTRSLRFTVDAPAFGQSAIKVTMIDLQNPNPPNLPQFPPPDFGAYESATCTAAGEANSCARWVGKPGTFLENQDMPGGATYKAAWLQCTPLYWDWKLEGLITVVGAEIAPSSEYSVQTYGASCMGAEDGCTNVSTAVTMYTRRSGDAAPNFNPPSTTGQPDALDVAAVVNKLKNLPGAPIKAISQLQPNLPELNANVNALDIVAVVDGVKGVKYAFSGPCACPSAVTCGSACGTGCPAPNMCVKTCVGGANIGDPCINNTHCPGSTCGNPLCRDRCGRCTP